MVPFLFFFFAPWGNMNSDNNHKQNEDSQSSSCTPAAMVGMEVPGPFQCVNQHLEPKTADQYIIKHQENGYQCLICDKDFKAKFSCLRHIKNVHLMERLTCDICQKTFQSVSGLRNHQLKHKSGTLTCPFADCSLKSRNTTFYSIQKLNSHLTTKHGKYYRIRHCTCLKKQSKIYPKTCLQILNLGNWQCHAIAKLPKPTKLVPKTQKLPPLGRPKFVIRHRDTNQLPSRIKTKVFPSHHVSMKILNKTAMDMCKNINIGYMSRVHTK